MALILIEEGMTSGELITAFNSNAYVVLPTFIEITDEMNGTEVTEALNYGLSTTLFSIGMKGSSLIYNINTLFSMYNNTRVVPTSLAIEWIKDFVSITFTDESGGEDQHEIWESKDSGVYQLVGTLDEGVEIYEYPTWQNCNLSFRIRAKNGSEYSDFAEKVSITTPLIFETNQSILVTTGFNKLRMTEEGTIHIDWGDGTSDDYDDNSWDNDGITKDYTETQNPYYITISGDVDKIAYLDVNYQVDYCMDCSKWILPYYLEVFEFCHLPDVYGNVADVWDLNRGIGINVFHIDALNFTGDATQWLKTIPSGNYEMRIAYNDFTGNATDILFPIDNGRTYFQLKLNYNHFTGDGSDWVFPDNTRDISISRNYLTADLSGWNIPTIMCSIELSDFEDEHNVFTGDISGWTLPTVIGVTSAFCFLLANQGLPGDLSGLLIPEGMGSTAGIIDLRGNSFTKMPRGDYNGMGTVNYSENNCNIAEIDAFLAFLDAYFVGEIVPLADCVYSLNGTGMGIPSAAGLTSRQNIIDKYVAEGKTCSILVNS